MKLNDNDVHVEINNGLFEGYMIRGKGFGIRLVIWRVIVSRGWFYDV